MASLLQDVVGDDPVPPQTPPAVVSTSDRASNYSIVSHASQVSSSTTGVAVIGTDATVPENGVVSQVQGRSTPPNPPLNLAVQWCEPVQTLPRTTPFRTRRTTLGTAGCGVKEGKPCEFMLRELWVTGTSRQMP